MALDTTTKSLTSDLSSNTGTGVGSTRALNDFTDKNSFESQANTIMGQYADRTRLAKEAASAGREGIKSDYAELTRDATQDEQKAIVNETEGQRGFAANLTAVREITNTGDRRIRDLNRARDQLILQNKSDEANRIDSLIANEQSAITAARTNWVNSLIAIGSEKRSEAGFKTSQENTQANTRNLNATTQATELDNRKKQMLLSFLGDGNIDGTGSVGSPIDTAANNLANGNVSAEALQQQYAAFGDLGVVMYQKAVARAMQINPNFSENNSNITYTGAKTSAQTENSGNISGSLFNTAKRNLTGGSSVFNLFSPARSTTSGSTPATVNAGTSGKTSTGIGYTITKK